MTWRPFFLWVLFFSGWLLVLLALADFRGPALCAFAAALFGWVTLIVFDTWRGKKDERAMRRRFECEESEPDGPIS